MLHVDDLVERAIQGDREALEGLLARYQRPLLSFVYRMVGRDRAMAEDLTQDVFLRIVANLGRFDPGRAPDAESVAGPARSVRAFEKWMFTIARNRIRDHWRAGRTAVSLDEDAIESLPAHEETGGGYESLERDRRLEQAIDRLPVAQREVLTLRVHSGLTFAEISDVMGAPLGTSLARMRYALANLKKILENEE